MNETNLRIASGVAEPRTSKNITDNCFPTARNFLRVTLYQRAEIENIFVSRHFAIGLSCAVRISYQAIILWLLLPIFPV